MYYNYFLFLFFTREKEIYLFFFLFFLGKMKWLALTLVAYRLVTLLRKNIEISRNSKYTKHTCVPDNNNSNNNNKCKKIGAEGKNEESDIHS